MTPVAVIIVAALTVIALLLLTAVLKLLKKLEELKGDLKQLQKRSESFRAYSDLALLAREIQDLGHEFTDEVLAKISQVLGPFRVKITIRDRTIFDTGIYPPGMAADLKLGVDLGSTHIYVEEYDEYGPRMADLYAIGIAINNWAERTHLSITDELTGLYNRRGWRQRVDSEMARAERYNHEVSLVMVDLDKFKDINDTYGHPTGDEVLIEAANLFLQIIREQIDVVARWGGDEFVFLLPETNREDAELTAERIRKAIESHPFPVDGIHAGLTASIGVATYPNCAGNFEELKKAADAALYTSKKNGRNRATVAPSR